MVTHLHIERQDGSGHRKAIGLDEWTAAVKATQGVRMANGDAAAADPVNKEMVVLPNRGGDVEVFRKDCRKWLRALFWTPDGTVRFVEPEMKEDPILPLASELAGKLGAGIYNEEGAAYP